MPSYRDNFLVSILFLFTSTPTTNSAFASGKIYYGSRAGMTDTVESMVDLDTGHAVIQTKHTRGDAIGFCREYVQKVTPNCIKEELDILLNDKITANCPKGEFVDFGGRRYRFEGRVRRPSANMMAKYVIRDLATGEIADGSSASGYPTNMQIFRALCPRAAPMDN
jgi:hypothetical protein